ncbi:Pentatricopeptide repeat-containing protein [Senna tora]|uniref:Pentatricopeptide repeat-containing protein n=1 Tax=Senna tora TaxID=362788 RepID=A0A834TZ81_9FABA|nr:Pentatricopeptide repeat-containing protein [Senna tora]
MQCPKIIAFQLTKFLFLILSNTLFATSTLWHLQYISKTAVSRIKLDFVNILRMFPWTDLPSLSLADRPQALGVAHNCYNKPQGRYSRKRSIWNDSKTEIALVAGLLEDEAEEVEMENEEKGALGLKLQVVEMHSDIAAPPISGFRRNGSPRVQGREVLGRSGEEEVATS